MGEPTYFDGPDYPDGTDAEGFPGGDQRFGIIKPTKERALQILEDLKILLRVLDWLQVRRTPINRPRR